MALPRLSIVTCCKGRLKYLKQALPTFVAQAESEVIVVDYDCPEGTKEWVAANFPEVRVVAINEAPVFNLSRARNLGAKGAQASWLVFCDADDLLSPSFSSDVLRLAEPSTYQRTLRNTRWGLKQQYVPLACETTTFWSIGGYDDAIRGWGIEDMEFVDRLRCAGVREVLGSATVAQTLPQRNLESRRYYEHDIEISVVINHYYWTIKHRYFERTGQWFSDEQRYSTYGSVERAVLGSLADPQATFDIPVVGSTTPWAARLTAPDVQSFLKKQSEKLRRLEESVQNRAP
jgi:predicted glycosyltransferase involved in capsule biosynthesis